MRSRFQPKSEVDHTHMNLTIDKQKSGYELKCNLFIYNYYTVLDHNMITGQPYDNCKKYHIVFLGQIKDLLDEKEVEFTQCVFNCQIIMFYTMIKHKI